MDASKQLLEASRSGRLEEVRQLVQNGVSPNIKEKNTGWTPLNCASLIGYLPIVVYLIENGAFLNAKTNVGLTSLHYASLNGNLLIVKALLEAGADYTIHNSKGKTAKDILCNMI